MKGAEKIELMLGMVGGWTLAGYIVYIVGVPAFYYMDATFPLTSVQCIIIGAVIGVVFAVIVPFTKTNEIQ